MSEVMFIVINGEVGLYADNDYITKAKPTTKIMNNNYFGEKALDSLEPR